MLNKDNKYFEEIRRIGHEYEERRQERKERKKQIIAAYGWESKELEAWYAENAAETCPISIGASKAYRAWWTSIERQEDEVEMDDFGTGYSSMNSLKELPLDVLKLDASFFRGADNGRGEVVVSDAIGLAKHLDMQVVAEGVEDKETVDFLARVDCDMIQGYYYAKPMPADEFAQRLVKAESSTPVVPEPTMTEEAEPEV